MAIHNHPFLFISTAGRVGGVVAIKGQAVIGWEKRRMCFSSSSAAWEFRAAQHNKLERRQRQGPQSRRPATVRSTELTTDTSYEGAHAFCPLAPTFHSLSGVWGER